MSDKSQDLAASLLNDQFLLGHLQTIHEFCSQDIARAKHFLASNHLVMKRLRETKMAVKQAAEVPTAFEQIDTNGDGVISKDELAHAQTKASAIILSSLRFGKSKTFGSNTMARDYDYGGDDESMEPFIEQQIDIPEQEKHSMFGQGKADVKERVLKALARPNCRADDFYKTEGFAPWLANNAPFNYFILAVIAVNTIWIAVETDLNKYEVLTDAPWLFIIVDNLFTIIFLVEIIVRYLSFGRKRYALQDFPFCFDMALVSLMIWETWIVCILFYVLADFKGGAHLKNASIFRLFRMFRLTRVARLARLLRAFPELLVLTRGALMGLRSVGATLILLFVTVYVYGIIFTQLLCLTPLRDRGFDTVVSTMNLLLLNCVLNVDIELLNALKDYNKMIYVLMISCIVISTFTIMNMLIGVICEVVSNTALSEREEILVQDLTVKVSRMLPHVDLDEGDSEGEETISKEAFHSLLDKPEAIQVLSEVGVDVVALIQLGENLDVLEFMELVLQFRGSNAATVKDLVDMRKYVTSQMNQMQVTVINKVEESGRVNRLQPPCFL